jgi:sugar phosphate isomerase/epimerase
MSFRYALNTSTIQPAPLMEKIRVAGAAGYDAIELWVMDVEDFVARRLGTLDDVRKALDDAGLDRPSMIYLKGWAEEDDAVRAQELEVCMRRLEIAARLGARRFVAGPPPGVVDLPRVARRYRELLELAEPFGVAPSIEFLGFVETVKTLDAAWAICSGADHPAATLTADAWHIFRGGGTADLLDTMPIERVSIYHWDDAPPSPPRDVQTDNDRVLPGDGILDLRGLAAQLRRRGYTGALSLELFNKQLWERNPREVVEEGLEKMKRSVE